MRGSEQIDSKPVNPTKRQYWATGKASRVLSIARRKLVQRRVRDALPEFYRAEASGADIAACAAGRWECYMLLGDFESAWKESDAIEQLDTADTCRLWDGSGLQDKRVMVRCLHGYGDAIQFIRYIPLLLKRKASVIVETHPEMVPVLRRASGVQHVITWGSAAPVPLPQWDVQIEIMELPRAFRTSLATVPAFIPYIRVAAREHAEFRDRLPVDTTASNGTKVGVIWKSSNWNPSRSMELSEMLPLCEVPGYEFYSLQWELTEDETCALRSHSRLHNLAGQWSTLEDFAILISSMDLIVTVDTVAAHLAGALGIPVWVLLPRSADWRWMLDREDSPWYPTMRLFRQASSNHWADCIRRAKAELVQRNCITQNM